jgi:hypothetical protein
VAHGKTAANTMQKNLQSFRRNAAMKRHKQKEKPGNKSSKSVKSLDAYLDNEVTLIHKNLDELKSFLAEHSAMVHENPLSADDKRIDDYYNSTDDLFRQVALETGSQVPLESLCYDTYLLRKKNKLNEKNKG